MNDRDKGTNAGFGAKGTEGKLLLIDDCSLVRRVFASAFGELGYGVATAASPSEGIRMGPEEDFDIVIVEGSLSEGEQEEIELGFGRLEPERVPIILEYAPRPAGPTASAERWKAIPVHWRKDFVPLATQIRELLSVGANLAA